MPASPASGQVQRTPPLQPKRTFHSSVRYRSLASASLVHARSAWPAVPLSSTRAVTRLFLGLSLPLSFSSLALLLFSPRPLRAQNAISARPVSEQISPSVVQIEVRNSALELTAGGSGVVVERRRIATNCHVVEKGTYYLVRHLTNQVDGFRFAADWERDTCIVATSEDAGRAALLGKSARLAVGQRVYALGSPLGLDLTFSEGLVSRFPSTGNERIQFSAPISPGSSGGGLFDAEGRLIGLTTSSLREGQMLNFAVPVEWIEALLKAPATGSGVSVERAVAEARLETVVEVLSASRNWKETLLLLAEWLKLDPRNGRAHRQAGLAFGGLDLTEISVQAFEKAVLYEPQDAEGWRLLGEAHEKGRRFPAAIRAYERARDLDPDNPAILSALGRAVLNGGSPGLSVPVFERWVELAPEDAQAWLSLSRALRLSGKPDRALALNQFSLRLNGKHAEAWLHLGRLHEDFGRLAKAIDSYRECVRLEPGNAEAWSSLGSALFRNGSHSEAIHATNRAVSLDPKSAQTWSNLGVMLKAAGRRREAALAYRKALEIDPGFAFALFNLGVLYGEERKREEVLQIYETLQRLDKSLAEAFFRQVDLP